MEGPGLAPSASPAAPAVTGRAVRLMLLATAGVCLLLFLWSLWTGPLLGDEAHHFRRAMVYAEAPWADMRATHDPVYPDKGQCAVAYWEAALWHLALAVLWKVLGHPSFIAAQAYHLGFLYLLGVFTFLSARRLYGDAGGWWAWALTMTMPLNILLATLFYLEVPVAAITAMAVYCLVRQRWALLGLALAGMFYIKLPSAAVLAPPLLLAAMLKIGPTWGKRLGRTAGALAIAAVLVLPDLAWRKEHFGHLIMLRIQSSGGTGGVQYPLMASLPAVLRSAVPLSIFDPATAVQNFGMSGLVALGFAVPWSLWGLGKTARRILAGLRSQGLVATVRTLADLVPAEVLLGGIPLLWYMVAYGVLLRMAYDIRYFHPAILFVSLLGSGVLARVRPLGYTGRMQGLVRAATWLLVLAMVGQLATAPYVIRQRRSLHPATASGFEWIRYNVPPGSRILYLEFNLTTLTERPILWAATIPRYLFSVPEREQMRVLRALDIHYIAIHPTRLVSDFNPAIEPLGYPREWVRSLPGRPYLQQVFPDPSQPGKEGDFILYRIDADKIPPEWLQDPPPKP